MSFDTQDYSSTPLSTDWFQQYTQDNSLDDGITPEATEARVTDDIKQQFIEAIRSGALTADDIVELHADAVGHQQPTIAELRHQQDRELLNRAAAIKEDTQKAVRSIGDNLNAYTRELLSRVIASSNRMVEAIAFEPATVSQYDEF